MNSTDPVAGLDDRQVIRALAEVPAELDGTHAPAGDGPATAEEARATLAAAVENDPAPVTRPEGTTPDTDSAFSIGRDLLRELLADPDTAAQIRDLVADPPGDDQMSFELLVDESVLIAVLVTWLQLKVKFKRVTSQDGTKTEFEVSKESLDSKNLGRILDLARRALKLGG